MKTFVQVEGLRELKDALEEFPKATSTNVLKRALMNAGEPIERAAVAYAPMLTGHLKRSFTAGTKLSRRQSAINQKESKVEVYVGPGALVQAITQEFGTKTNRAQPFLRPAWDGQKNTALGLIKTEIADEIEKARVRLAKKTAKYQTTK